MPKFYYVELEPLKERYTGILGHEWAPAAFGRANASGDYRFVRVPADPGAGEIKVGRVLDAEHRGRVALSQCMQLLELDITSDDVVYLQDFWTPGVEALLYAWHQKGVSPRLYARNFAQSVDEYDFTWPMRAWMRPIEVGLSRALSGMFVASTVHRDQLRAAGYACPIHVTGLPFGRQGPGGQQTRLANVLYTSRVDREKNPHFMLDVAEEFLERHSGWTWQCTTSATRFPASTPGFLERAGDLESVTRRFRMLCDVEKSEYYLRLRQSRIQFNSSLQDYVAFTMLEAADAGCDLVYPDWRSFPECVDASRLYRPGDVDDALRVLDECVRSPREWPKAPAICERGFVAEMAIMLTDCRREVNVWHEPASALEAEGL